MAATSCPVFPEPSQFQLAELATSNRVFLQELQRNNESESLIDGVALFSGMGIKAARDARDGYQTDIKLPQYNSSQGKLASVEQEAAIKTIAIAGSEHLLSQVFNQNQISETTIFVGSEALLYTLSYLLETGQDTERVVSAFLDAGNEPTVSDLILSAKHAVPVSLLAQMAHASNTDPHVRVFSHGVYDSLLTAALKHGNAEHAQYWMEQQAPINPDPLLANALDLLAQQQSLLHSEQGMALGEALIRQGWIPNRNKNLGLLRSVFGNLDNLQPANVVRKLGLSADEKIRVQQLAQRLFLAVLQKIRNHSGSVLTECDVKDARRYIKRSWRAEKQYKVQQSANQSKLADSYALPAITLQQVQTLPDRGVGVESVNDKQRTHDEKLAKAQKDAAAAKQDAQIAEQLQQMREVLEQVYALIKAKQWFEALTVLENADIEGLDGQLFSIMLQLALAGDPPGSFVDHLVSRGAKPTSASLAPAIKNNNIDVFETLVALGLNTDYVDPLGNTALMLSVISQAPDIFSYLLRNTVEPFREDNEFDALDIALKAFRFELGGDYYVRELIQSGVQVKNSHREIVGLIADQAAYDYLVSEFPSLQAQ